MRSYGVANLCTAKRPVHHGVGGRHFCWARKTVARCKPTHPALNSREYGLILNGLAKFEPRRMFSPNEELRGCKPVYCQAACPSWGGGSTFLLGAQNGSTLQTDAS